MTLHHRMLRSVSFSFFFLLSRLPLGVYLCFIDGADEAVVVQDDDVRMPGIEGDVPHGGWAVQPHVRQMLRQFLGKIREPLTAHVVLDNLSIRQVSSHFEPSFNLFMRIHRKKVSRSERARRVIFQLKLLFPNFGKGFKRRRKQFVAK